MKLSNERDKARATVERLSEELRKHRTGGDSKNARAGKTNELTSGDLSSNRYTTKLVEENHALREENRLLRAAAAQDHNDHHEITAAAAAEDHDDDHGPIVQTNDHCPATHYQKSNSSA